MTYEQRRTDPVREHIWVVEIDLEQCSLVYSEAPCTASIGVTGTQECFQTFASCQDQDNFATATKTYRFCSQRSPHPIGLDAVPNLAGVDCAPSIADLSGGLGIRASVSLRFVDHPSSDLGIDPYIASRSYDAFRRSTFWAKLRARNPYYQGRALRLKSGYLVDGVYDDANFETRYFVIETLAVGSGVANVVAKDPLKLADSSRAQAPRSSNGQLAAAITNADLAFSVEPAGIGDAEYPASGYVRIRSEVLGFTRTADAFTVTRAEFNTTAEAHSEDDTVQLCLHYDGVQVQAIVADLLETYAGVDPAFIPITEWDSEADTFLPGLLSALITEPTGVQQLLKELGEQAPHSLFWNERRGLIQFLAIKAPPIGATVFDSEKHLMGFTTRDELAMRVSTVIVNFGQFNPTKRLDEFDNYQQTYVRIDADSVAQYGSSAIKTINSRWISNTNKAAAVLLASRIGRRFAVAPRSAAFSLDPKDLSVWTGDSLDIEHEYLPDFDGSPKRTTFQITSAKEDEARFSYTAIEYNYADPGSEDPPDGVGLVLFGGDLLDVDLREVWDDLFPAPDEETVALFIVESAATIGASSNTEYAIRTGTWPAGASVTLEVRGNVLGKGGRGGRPISGQYDGQNGGTAILLENDLDLVNFGTIGGGGGGGGAAGIVDPPHLQALAEGGGGAGRSNAAYAGSDTTGGVGQYGFSWFGDEGNYIDAQGGTGGDLAQSGTEGLTSGVGTSTVGTFGTGGDAIHCDGYTLNTIETGTIIGAVEA